MTEQSVEMDAVLKAVLEGTKRDNSSYHKAIGEARKAFEDAESWLGGPACVTTKIKTKKNGKYVVKWTFKLLE